MSLPDLASPADVRDFGYDVATVAPRLYQASARVRTYLRRRASATVLFTAQVTASTELAEIVCSIANRIAVTHPQVVMGAVSEGSGGENLTFGAQAFAGTSGLLDIEKTNLDALYPKGTFRSVDVLQ